MRYNPFNPQQPARPDFFVGRESETAEFEHFLSQTMHGSPMNMSVTGNRGMGKTSLLIKFEEIARQNGCLTLRLSNYEGNVADIIDFSDYLCANLKGEFLSRKPVKKNIDRLNQIFASFHPTVGWKDVSLTIERKQIVQELLRQKLLKLWDEMKDDYKAAVILVDEAESLEKVAGALTFLREVFQRVSMDANYLVVLAGKLNFPERMSESFSPLNRFFPCQRLASFSPQEIQVYVTKKLDAVGVTIDETALQQICERSEGHPYVLVAMCYLLFDSLQLEESRITAEVVMRSQEKIDTRLAQDFFAPMYHPLTPKAREILRRIAEKADTLTFSFKQSVDWTGLDGNYVAPYIKELLRKGVLNKPGRGQYQIFHILFLEYLRKI